MIDLAKFIEQYLGKPGIGNTDVNRGQCVGLVEVWLTANGKPHIWGNAAEMIANADSKTYRKVVNIPTNHPRPGAIVCWGSSWGAGAGHTAVVVAANAMGLVVFEQNDPTGSPPVVATHSYSGVQGWIIF